MKVCFCKYHKKRRVILHVEHKPQLAALVASKVYFYLGELKDALEYALGAGSLFNVEEGSDFVESLLSKEGPYAAGASLTEADFSLYPTVCVFMWHMLCAIYTWPNPLWPGRRPKLFEWQEKVSALPAAQRELGDAYVKSEFRSHRDADAKFLAAFESQWREYLGVLRSQSVDAPGRDLTADELSAMSDEQKVQVVDIYEKSRKAGDEKPDS